MARKGKKRSIAVFGCTLMDGTQLNHTDDDFVSVIVNPDKSVSTTDANGNETILEGAEWVSYIPRTN